MFARQISLELDLVVGDKHAIARMLTQVVELPTHLLTNLTYLLAYLLTMATHAGGEARPQDAG